MGFKRVDLGKGSKRDIERLLDGEGPLATKLEAAIGGVTAKGVRKADAPGDVVVAVVKQKKRRFDPVDEGARLLGAGKKQRRRLRRAQKRMGFR